MAKFEGSKWKRDEIFHIDERIFSNIVINDDVQRTGKKSLGI